MRQAEFQGWDGKGWELIGMHHPWDLAQSRRRMRQKMKHFSPREENSREERQRALWSWWKGGGMLMAAIKSSNSALNKFSLGWYQQQKKTPKHLFYSPIIQLFFTSAWEAQPPWLMQIDEQTPRWMHGLSWDSHWKIAISFVSKQKVLNEI